MSDNIDWLKEARKRTVVNIGQLAKAEISKLDAAVKRGEISKWKGYWHPVPGADWGSGPLKTCYGPK